MGNARDTAELVNKPEPEYGINANGEYWKYPDGQLICTNRLTLIFDDADNVRSVWTFPYPFAAIPESGMTLQSNSSNWTSIPTPAGRSLAQAVQNVSVFTESTTAATFAAWAESTIVFSAASEIREQSVIAVGTWL